MDVAASKTWVQDLVEYFRELGGAAHYSELYRHIETSPRRKLGVEWRAVVRRTIEEHSSDTTIWRKRHLPDLFRSVDGLGAGRWALREMDPQLFGLKPGETIKRKSLRLRYGGSSQGGIIPSRMSPNVFLFSDPSTGEEHGYFDGWNDDGSYHYTGSGQHGDQKIGYAPNAATLNHKRDNRALRLFHGSRDVVTYVGEFELDAIEPYFLDFVPETGGGANRWAIIFRLRPVGEAYSIAATQMVIVLPNVMDIPIENQIVESMVVKSQPDETIASRREAKLVNAFAAEAERHGLTVTRKRIVVGKTAGPFLTDAYVKELHLLIEAKGTTDRDAFRMALGQLFDYRRFMQEPHCAILLPKIPSDDLLQLAKAVDIDVIWISQNSFDATFSIW